MTAEKRLVAQYKRHLDLLLKRIERMEARGTWAGMKKRIALEIAQTIAELDGVASRELPKLVREAFRQGTDEARKSIGVSLGGALNKRAIRYISENAADDMIRANHFFGRHWNDAARRIGLETVEGKLMEELTVKQASRQMVRHMQEQGWTAFIDKGGRAWRLDTYANLVARTTTREATNTATLEAGREWKHDLVLFTKRFPTCKVCAAIQGRVFSISGNDKRFPYLYDLPGFKDGFSLPHPHCRHNLVITIERLWTEAERAKYLADGKKPIDYDPRSKKEVDMYNKEQKIQRVRNADRRQYEKMKKVLGSEAPKSFSGYRSMKRANSKRWKELRQMMHQLTL